MRKLELIILSIVLAVGFAARLYKLDRPIADWHSWRQADTASVARNFLKEGFNPFVPKYDDMSSQASGLDNPNRYRFVEFPIYNSIIALVWHFTGIETIYARLVNVVASLISSVFLYLIVKKFSGIKTALFSTVFFTLNPFNIFYSSSILPGPFMVTMLLGFYYSFINFMSKRTKTNFALSVIFANAAILVWPISLFFFLPALWLAYDEFGKIFYKQKILWFLAAFSILPFVAWRLWMLNFPEGIPGINFLINEGNIRFKGAFFRWIITERLGGIILGATGFALFITGLVQKINKSNLFYFTMLLSSVAYIVYFASGNVRHDYYQVPIMPTLAIFMGLGASTLTNPKIVSRILGYPLVILLTIFSIVLTFYEIKGFYWVNRPEIIEVGGVVDSILPKDAIVIAQYNGDVALLYHTNRYGYPLVERPLVELIDRGAKYFISVEPQSESVRKFSEKCTILAKTDKYVIIEISRNCI